MNPLVQPLFDGLLDIVGDVHGEIDALRSLMAHLGYGSDGQHPQGRRLVFVGDLTDRGPDSPAVVDLVASLIEAGRAQCVLGNHDLNILLAHRKPENKWFWGEDFFDEDGLVAPQLLANPTIQERVLSLFRCLPIALERDDLRVIHACWNDEMIQAARQSSDVVGLYEHYHELVLQSFPGLDLDKIDRSLEHQNRNPVKRLTSGPEERSDVPIQSGGKFRNERRVHWWNDYAGQFCVFGHYSILDLDEQHRGSSSAFCVDYGVGQRCKERRAGKSSGFAHRLGAVRFPERQVVFDEGEPIKSSVSIRQPRKDIGTGAMTKDRQTTIDELLKWLGEPCVQVTFVTQKRADNIAARYFDAAKNVTDDLVVNIDKMIRHSVDANSSHGHIRSWKRCVACFLDVLLRPKDLDRVHRICAAGTVVRLSQYVHTPPGFSGGFADAAQQIAEAIWGENGLINEAAGELTIDTNAADSDGYISIWNLAKGVPEEGRSVEQIKYMASRLLNYLCWKKWQHVYIGSNAAKEFEREKDFVFASWAVDADAVRKVAEHSFVPLNAAVLFLNTHGFDPSISPVHFPSTQQARYKWFSNDWIEIVDS